MPDPHYDALHFIFYSDENLPASAYTKPLSQNKTSFARRQNLPGIDRPFIGKGLRVKWRRRRDSTGYRKWVALLDGNQDALYLGASATVMLLQVFALLGMVVVVSTPLALGVLAATLVLGLGYGVIRYKRQLQKAKELNDLRLQVSGRWHEICNLQLRLSPEKPNKHAPSKINNLVAELRTARRRLNTARCQVGLTPIPRSETWVNYENSFIEILEKIQINSRVQRRVFSKEILDSLVAKISPVDAGAAKPLLPKGHLARIERGIIFARSWFSAFKNTRSLLIALTGFTIAISFGVATGGAGFIIAGVIGGLIYGLIASEHIKNCEYISDLKFTMHKYNSQLEYVLCHLQLKERQIIEKIARLNNQYKLIERELRYIPTIESVLDCLWEKDDTHIWVDRFYTDPNYHAFDLLRDLNNYLQINADKINKGTVEFLRKQAPQFRENLLQQYSQRRLEDSKAVRDNRKTSQEQLQHYYEKCCCDGVPDLEFMLDAGVAAGVDEAGAYKLLRAKRFAHKSK